MRDGKYRWMTPEEAQSEIEDGSLCWVSFFGGKVRPALYLSYVQNVFVIGSELGRALEPRDRICRAMVPEAPHLSETEHGE